MSSASDLVRACCLTAAVTGGMGSAGLPTVNSIPWSGYVAAVGARHARVAGHDETELGLRLPAQVQLVHGGEDEGHRRCAARTPGAVRGHEKPV